MSNFTVEIEKRVETIIELAKSYLVNEWVKTIDWSGVNDDQKTIIIGNVRAFLEWFTSEKGKMAVEHCVEADALPCGHNQGIEFGESSWSCAVCGQPVRRSR